MRPWGNNITLCPHCGHRAYTLNSEQLTLTYRELRFACSNAPCGHIFVAELTIVRTLVPSALPNPIIDIPLGKPRKRPDTEADANQIEMFGQTDPEHPGEGEAA